MYAAVKASRFKVSHKINTGRLLLHKTEDVKLHGDDVGTPKPLD